MAMSDAVPPTKSEPERAGRDEVGAPHGGPTNGARPDEGWGGGGWEKNGLPCDQGTTAHKATKLAGGRKRRSGTVARCNASALEVP